MKDLGFVNFIKVLDVLFSINYINKNWSIRISIVGYCFNFELLSKTLALTIRFFKIVISSSVKL